MKDYTMLEKWNDDYDECAIYSLVDENGKRYIGQAHHLQRRLETHRQLLNRAYKRPDAPNDENSKLYEAAKNGTRFRVEVLHKLEWIESTDNRLRELESYYLNLYGGVKATYNGTTVPLPNWTYEPANDVTLDIMLDKIDDKAIVELLQGMDNPQGYIKELIRQDIGAVKIVSK